MTVMIMRIRATPIRARQHPPTRRGWFLIVCLIFIIYNDCLNYLCCLSQLNVFSLYIMNLTFSMLCWWDEQIKLFYCWYKLWPLFSQPEDQWLKESCFLFHLQELVALHIMHIGCYGWLRGAVQRMSVSLEFSLRGLNVRNGHNVT